MKVFSVNRDYSLMFPDLRDKQLSKSEKLKKFGKAFGLWVATLGIYPAIAAGVHHHRAKLKTPNDSSETDIKVTILGKKLTESSLKQTPTVHEPSTDSGQASSSLGTSAESEVSKVEAELPEQLIISHFTMKIAPSEVLDDKVYIYISGPCPPDKAFEVLHEIAEQVGSRYTMLEVKEEGSVATDAGGPRRQFFSKLIEDLVSHPPGSKYFDKDGSGLRLPLLPFPSGDEDLAFFRDLGKVLGLCSAFTIPIGPQFHRTALELLIKMGNNQEFAGKVSSYDFTDSKTFELFYPLYKEILNQSQNGQVALEGFKIIRAKIEQTEEDKELVEIFQDNMKNRLLPLLAILEGFKQNSNTDDGIADRVLGIALNGEALSKKLVFDLAYQDDPIQNDKQEWIKNWVRNAPKDQLEKFLFTATGTKGIAPNHLIRFQQFTTEAFKIDPSASKIDTCNRKFAMNFNAFETEEALHAALSAVISFNRSYNAE